MRTAIIYKSDYGSTKRYAIKISEQLQCEILDVKNIDEDKLNDYEGFIFCSNVINGKLGILPFIKKHINYLYDKPAIMVINRISDHDIEVKDFLSQAFTYMVPIFYLEGSVKNSTRLLHTIGILKANQYYKHKPKLLKKIKHGSIPSKWSNIDYIVNYSREVMGIAAPKPIHRNRKHKNTLR